MFSDMATSASSCWKRNYSRMNKDCNSSSSYDEDQTGSGGDGSRDKDELLWYRDLDQHSGGDFSFAVVQANVDLEDYSQVEIGRDAVFVGVYDGHGGPEAAKFVSDHLFHNLMKRAKEYGTMSEDILRSAILATEEGFLTLVRRSCGIKPSITAVGTCCLVGLICSGILYIANVGDSRAVMGSLGRSNKIVAVQLTQDHNANMEEVRQELKSLHPDDSQIVVFKQGVWRIKGIIQVSRSIGDAYLKRPELSLDPSFPRFHLPEPIRRPVLTAEPSIEAKVLRPNNRFLIFASDGLWEHMTNQEAVETVFNNPRKGVAKRLVRKAQMVAAKKSRSKYAEIKKVEKGERRSIHDDITVVVVFLDHESPQHQVTVVPELSVRGFVSTDRPSKFSMLQGGLNASHGSMR